MFPFLEPLGRRWRGGMSFRVRFLLAMMAVVVAITAAVFVITQLHVASTQQRDLEELFQGQTNYLLSARTGRLTAITDKCHSLSRSVRIRAALEEDDVEDLYRNALDELRGVIDGRGPSGSDAPARGGSGAQALPQANFFGFVDSRGNVLPPPPGIEDGDAGSGAAFLEAFARQVAARESQRLQTASQNMGYLLIPARGRASAVLDEVIVSPIENPASGEEIGALVLGFPAETPRNSEAPAERAVAGIWVSGTIRGLNVPNPAIPGLVQALSKSAAHSPRSGHFQVEADGAPALLFYQALEVGEGFPPAYGVCLYSLADSLRQQAQLRWRIIGWGAAALAVGFALSVQLSRQLSAPVEQMAKGAVENLAGRQRAEAELLETNEQLEHALAELKATQAQIIQQERLRALGEMASGIAHDFNNALMPILGFSELLLGMPQALDDRDKTISYLQIINRGARDAGNVVRRLREFYRSREEDEEFLPVGLGQLAGQIADLTQPKWKDQALARGVAIDFRTHLEPVPVVLGNESDLREALTNLVFNAVDAMPRDGTLTLAVRRDGACGVVELTDTGTGMSEAVRIRCLEPFFSTKGERGTGLGLSMVFGIVQRHHGTVEIDSREGEGSTFRLRLPLMQESPDRAHTEAAQHPPKCRSLRVLAVDDEPQVREILTHMLEGEGHSVVTAVDAREALGRFRSELFDLVITDMAMPGMNGEQLASTIKSLAPVLPVVLLTGFGGFIDSSQKAPGVDVLASKPITLHGLRSCIQTALEACDAAI